MNTKVKRGEMTATAKYYDGLMRKWGDMTGVRRRIMKVSQMIGDLDRERDDLIAARNWALNTHWRPTSDQTVLLQSK